MTYEEYVNEVFADHHDSMGMGTEEIKDLIEESTHQQKLLFLQRLGYDLRKDYHAHVNC